MLAFALSLTIVLPACAFPSEIRTHAGRMPQAPSLVQAASAGSGTYFDYVVFIIMENHAICDILTTCGGSAPYMTSLANASGLSTKTVDCNTPSLPNYLCLSGASDFGCAGYDGLPDSNACTAAAWNATNIVDRLEAGGVTWKAYMEGMPSNCYGSDSGLYMAHHDPFVYYSDIVTNPTRCARVVPAGTNDSALLTDLGSATTASNFMWLTPNSCDDMHGCSVATGDAFLRGLVPKILSSSVFTTQRAALFITFDEDSGGLGAPDIYSVWSGPAAKKMFSSANPYDHFSFLKTVEANWNLASLTTNDASAVAMAEFFAAPSPGFTIAANPSTVLGAIGQTVISTISLTAVGGFTGTVALNASSQPAGPILSFNPAEIAPGQTATCSMSASSMGNYSITVTGKNGTLVRTATIALEIGTAPNGIQVAFTYAPVGAVVGGSLSFAAAAVHGTAPYSFLWQFGDGTTATGANVSHAYGQAGTYLVSVTATDANGRTASTNQTVTVAASGSSGSSPAPASPTSILADLPFIGLLGVMVIVIAVALRGRNEDADEDRDEEPQEESEDSLDE